MISLTPRYRPLGPTATAPVVVYGTSWCAASQMVRRHLERLGVPYRYVDLEADPVAASQVAWLTGGYASHPTVWVAGSVLVEPSIPELDRALVHAGLVAGRGWW